MKPVKTRPRFKCDFCRRTSTKEAMERHEKICWKNPNRFCDLCKNEGSWQECYDEGICQEFPCPYCSQGKETPEEPKPADLQDESTVAIEDIPF